jgi:DNA-binding PadR family transcriptional regulator
MELLILYALSKKELTMYAVSKAIMDSFAAYTQPSFGAIKPALTRLEKGNFIRSRKAMSDGGKLSGFYSTTSEGQEELKKLLLEKISSNPLQFNSNARIKLSCASFLDKDERSELFFQIKTKAQEHKYADWGVNMLSDAGEHGFYRIGIERSCPGDSFERYVVHITTCNFCDLGHPLVGTGRRKQKDQI